ncbi:tetratricopeptide repeat protein [Lentibacter algarum]|uniref:tetratricopeptide repeat protein n=1 Tax=Lentibacter algarum TaxID=576131 RepID=UPI001C0936B5|nr:tetratricopeptide repeat protein [Lentibacter algarum]MBU2982981.1 tetratricopeptide repeat protein [Lentibacter algarum]
MRHIRIISLCAVGIVALAGCEKSGNSEVSRAFKDVNVVDESNMSDIMLTVADPNEAVSYFKRSSAENPDRADLQRGLAQSLVRAKRASEALPVYVKLLAHEDSTNEDRVNYADALIRADQWPEAEAALNKVPPTHETFKRYRLEAMIADSNKQWKKADSFYETAVGLTTKPSGVLNNWGYSKLARGDYAGAERLFGDAIRQDKSLFTAKNNMVLARGAQGNYNLPVIPMNQTERAELLHTMALAAIKRGDVETGKGLLREAVNTHPQHFEAAVRSLRALEANVTN